MAADAVAGDVRVVEVRRQPGNGRVTIVAISAARDVRRVLAGGNCAVVTGAAGAYDLRVVDCKRGCEYIDRVAILADVAGKNVLRILTGSVRAVMAADAAARNIRVIEKRR